MTDPMRSRSDLQENGGELLGERTAISLLFIFFCLMAWPLFRKELIFAPDISHSFFKEIALFQAWSAHNFLARWTPDAVFGYGYPMLNFYAPLFSVWSVLWTFILRDFVLGFNAAMASSLFLSGLTMYYFAKKFWGPNGAFVSAIAYLYAPYHILDIYFRGACAESLSFVFFPLVLLFIYRVHHKKNHSNLLWGSLSVAGLCLSHNIMGFLGMFLAFSFSVFLHFSDRQKTPLKLFRNFLVLGWGLALAAFFWLPAMAEKKFIHLDLIVSGTNAFQRHFPDFAKIFFSFFLMDEMGNMRYQAGTAHILIAIIVLFLAKKNASRNPELWRHARFWAGVILVSFFFMIKLSSPFWEFSLLCRIMNFPWRFLTFVTFATSFLAGGIVFFCPKDRRKTTLITALAALVLLNIVQCNPIGFTKIAITNAREFLFSSRPGDSEENLPMWVSSVKNLPMPSPNRLTLRAEHATILSYKAPSEIEHVYRLKSDSQDLAFFHTFYFPGWKVYIDGKETLVSVVPRVGAMGFTVPAGEHDLIVRFEETPIRMLSNIISLVSALCLLLLAFFLGYRRLRSSNPPGGPKSLTIA